LEVNVESGPAFLLDEQAEFPPGTESMDLADV